MVGTSRMLSSRAVVFGCFLITLPLFMSFGPVHGFTVATTESLKSGTNTITVDSTYYAAPGKLRVETRTKFPGAAEQETIIITLYGESNVTEILLYPKSKQYLKNVETKAAYLADSSSNDQWMFVRPDDSGGICSQAESGCSRVGSDTVLGRHVEKWLVKGPDGKGGTLKLFLWYDPALHFIVKSDIGGTIPTKIVAQSPSAAMFEIPAGYTKKPL